MTGGGDKGSREWEHAKEMSEFWEVSSLDYHTILIWIEEKKKKLKIHCIHRNEVEGDGRREHLKIR